jgi:4-hydroxy-tetrahydrodipicolinate synthase
MRPLTASDLRGTWGTVLLPIDHDDAIDYGRLGVQLAHLTDSGLQGIYTNGTAGEFMTQSTEEYLEISRLVAEACAHAGLPFQLGASHVGPQACLERVRSTRHLEPSAYQVILPDWVAPTDAEAVDFLRRVAEAADGVPLVLYWPPHAKRSFSAAAVAHLAARVPELIGIKVADGNPSWYGALRAHLGGLAVFVPGHHLASGLLQGAHGSYSNVACLSPRGAVRWHRLAASDPLAALDVERRIVDFLQVSAVPLAAEGYSNPALDKFLAAVGGWADVGTRLRWPYQWIPEERVEPFRTLVREMVPELWDDAGTAERDTAREAVRTR